MAKADRKQVLNRLQSTARAARTALANRLLAHGFYAGQDQVMLALAAEDGQTPGKLAERMAVRPPTITKTINRLQTQGFLEKRASSEDQRQAHVFLTETGRAAIKAIEKSVRKTEKQLMKGLDKKDQKALARLLSRIEANLGETVVDAVESEIDEPLTVEPEAADADAPAQAK